MTKNKKNPFFAATTMGAVPYRDMEYCCRVILDNFPEAPCLPVMTRGVRWMLEGIPCLTFDREKRMIYMDPSPAREKEILEFYDRYFADDLEYFATTMDTAPFFHFAIQKFKEARPPELKWVIYRTAGPMVLGESIKQTNGTAVFHHDTLRDILIKGLNMKTRWMEAKINSEIPDVEVIADMAEASLVTFTSSAGTGSRETMVQAVNEGFSKVNCLKWVHSCANIDWSLLTDSDIDIINLDAFLHSENLALYHKQIKAFLERGGMIGWGIVPVIADLLREQTLSSLVEKMQQALDLFVKKGIDEELLASSSWVLSSCETVLLPDKESDRVFNLTRDVSHAMREKYGFHA